MRIIIMNFSFYHDKFQITEKMLTMSEYFARDTSFYFDGKISSIVKNRYANETFNPSADYYQAFGQKEIFNIDANKLKLLR
jgi:hypothetical protein